MDNGGQRPHRIGHVVGAVGKGHRAGADHHHGHKHPFNGLELFAQRQVFAAGEASSGHEIRDHGSQQ